MAASIFSDKTIQPSSTALDAALGKSSVFLIDIEQHILDQFGSLSHEWKFYSKKAGWTLALVHNGRRLFHLIPQTGRFIAVFTLGDRAVSIVKESSLPIAVKSDIASARKYVEGRSLRCEVNTSADAGIVKQLVVIKLSS